MIRRVEIVAIRALLACECLLLPVSPIPGSKEDGRGEDVDDEQFYRYEVFGQCVSGNERYVMFIKEWVP